MKRLNKKGISLIEVLISLAIFGVLMVLFSTLMGVAIQMRKNVFNQASSSMEIMKDIANSDKELMTEDKEVVIQFQGSKQLKIKGSLVSKEDQEVSYQLFVPYE